MNNSTHDDGGGSQIGNVGLPTDNNDDCSSNAATNLTLKAAPGPFQFHSQLHQRVDSSATDNTDSSAIVVSPNNNNGGGTMGRESEGAAVTTTAAFDYNDDNDAGHKMMSKSYGCDPSPFLSEAMMRNRATPPPTSVQR